MQLYFGATMHKFIIYTCHNSVRLISSSLHHIVVCVEKCQIFVRPHIHAAFKKSHALFWGFHFMVWLTFIKKWGIFPKF